MSWGTTRDDMRGSRWFDDGLVCRGKNRRALDGDEAVGGDTEGSVVVESSPGSSFEVVESELVFEFEVVVFDAPAEFVGLDEFTEGGGGWEVGECVFGWFFFADWPFDE